MKRTFLNLLVVALLLMPALAFAQTATPTSNPSIKTPGTRLTTERMHQLTSFAGVGGKTGKLAELYSLAVRQIKRQGTNATALGLSDVDTVTSIIAFTTSDGAAATKALLVEPTDYTVGNGDITPVGDASAQTWIITYRP